MKAILAGLKKRHEKLGDLPILIQTVCHDSDSGTAKMTHSPNLQSGTAVLIDDARGEYASTTITSDLDLAALEALPPSAPHHVVDLLTISADTDGYARTYLVFPGVIYGLGHGPLYDAGISNRHSISVPWFGRAFLKRGRAGVVGKGACIWPNVHIDDSEYLRLSAVSGHD